MNPSPFSCQRVFFLAAVGWSCYSTPFLYQKAKETTGLISAVFTDPVSLGEAWAYLLNSVWQLRLRRPASMQFLNVWTISLHRFLRNNKVKPELLVTPKLARPGEVGNFWNEGSKWICRRYVFFLYYILALLIILLFEQALKHWQETIAREDEVEKEVLQKLKDPSKVHL